MTYDDVANEDWEQVFSQAPYDTAPPGLTLRTTFETSDIAEILETYEVGGSYAEWEGVMIGRLKDGRYFTASGWCDTTGWGCRDDAVVFVAMTETDARAFGLTEEQRDLLAS